MAQVPAVLDAGALVSHLDDIWVKNVDTVAPAPAQLPAVQEPQAVNMANPDQPDQKQTQEPQKEKNEKERRK